MLLRHRLYFVAVVVAVTTFLVSFHLGSMRHVQSYNSGIIEDVVSAVVEMEKINPYKPSLPGKLLSRFTRFLFCFAFLTGYMDKTSVIPVFQSADHVIKKTDNSISQCKLRQLFSKSQLTKERNTYLIHFLLGTVFIFEEGSV